MYERLADIDIPENVLAECGVDEVDLNFSCQKYAEEDENEEVQKLLNGLYMPGTYMNEENEKLKNERLDEKLVDEFDTKRVKALHEFMIKDLQRICKEFVSMPEEERWKYCPIRLEKAVEAIVAVKVEKEYGYRSEVVEAAMNKVVIAFLFLYFSLLALFLIYGYLSVQEARDLGPVKVTAGKRSVLPIVIPPSDSGENDKIDFLSDEVSCCVSGNPF